MIEFLPEGYGPAFFLIDCLNVLPTQFLFAFTLVKILGTRHPKLYWTLTIASTLLFMPFRTTVPLSLKALFSVVCLLVLPIALLRGNLFKKTMVVVIANTIMAAAEFPAGLIWVALTGSEIMDYGAVLTHIPEYLGGAILFHMGCCILSLWALYRICKYLGISEERSTQAGIKDDIAYQAFLPFVLVQMPLLYIVAFMELQFMNASTVDLFVAIILYAAAIVADALLLFDINRYQEKERIDMEAEMLSRSVDESLAAASAMQASLKEAAALRHDLRNHMHVVKSLCEHGEYEDARAYLDETRMTLLPKGSWPSD